MTARPPRFEALLTAICLGALATLALLPSAARAEGRPIAIISDLHFGLGHAGSAWSPYEDFRWGADLQSFLAAVRAWGGDRVDLVIAGDLLELWQHPGTDCEPPDHDRDYGCNLKQIDDVVAVVVEAHRDDLRALGAFAKAGDNRLYVVPGNHDAALLLDGVWNRVSAALGAPEARAARVASGRWTSPDGAVAVEHGHQIGQDVNRFRDWPAVTRLHLGERRLIRTWGEQFVQKLFNRVEKEYPLIDNLQPVSAGIKYYRESAGEATLPQDLARFVVFNVLETSLAQKISLGPAGSKPGEGPRWDMTAARSRGYRLLADAMDDADPQRQLLLGQSDEAKELRPQLDSLLADREALPEEDLLVLCDRVAARAAAAPASGRQVCSETLMLSTLQKVVPENRVLGWYLDALRGAQPGLRLFVYGHTHEMRKPWPLHLEGGDITVVNTGAFQRLVDEETLRAEAARRKTTPAELFKTWPLEDLPACYPAVFVEYQNATPEAKLKNWYVDPATGKGEPVDACDARCGYRNQKTCGG